MQHVSSSPSKIPDIGFSPVRLQTGIQSQPSHVTHGLSARPTYFPVLQAYMRLKPFNIDGRNYYLSRAYAQEDLPSMRKNHPVQRPLAHQRVMLSHQVIAYYGLIRNSRPLPLIYELYSGSLPYGLVWAGTERLPNLLRMSVSTVPPSVPRRARRLLSVVPSPSVLAFTISAQVRHPQHPARRFSRGKSNEAAKFALCYGPVELLALHRQGRLLSSFRLSGSPQSDVEYNYTDKQPISAAGLSPARHAALWAASRVLRV